MCINIDKLTNRVTLLEQGAVLYFRHMVYGTYKVYMNLQRNRILREAVCPTAKRRTDYDLTTVSTTFKGQLNGCITDPQRATTEEDVNYLLLWGCGEWFLRVNTSPLTVREV